MTTEDNGSSAAPEVAPAAAAAPAPQPMPDRAPPEGTRYVMNPKTGMYDVERLPDAQQKPTEPTDEEAAAKKAEDDSKVADAYKRGNGEPQLPEHLPSSILNDPEVPALLGDVGGILSERGLGAPQQQRLVDIFSEFYVEDRNSNLPEMMPAGPDGRAANEDVFRSILRQRWGSQYETRLKQAQAQARQLGPAFVSWLNKSGAGNSPAMLETLASWADGTTGLNQSQAKAKLDALRADPKGPLRNASHPGHKIAVAQARVLSMHLANGDGDGKGGVDRKVATMQDAGAKAEGTVDAATQKLDEEIQKIRLDPQYFKSGPASKVLRKRMAELMRQRWPD